MRRRGARGSTLRFRRSPTARGSRRVRVARYGRFYEEDERIVGHAADVYHRIDIRRSPGT